MTDQPDHRPAPGTALGPPARVRAVVDDGLGDRVVLQGGGGGGDIGEQQQSLPEVRVGWDAGNSRQLLPPHLSSLSCMLLRTHPP